MQTDDMKTDDTEMDETSLWSIQQWVTYGEPEAEEERTMLHSLALGDIVWGQRGVPEVYALGREALPKSLLVVLRTPLSADPDATKATDANIETACDIAGGVYGAAVDAMRVGNCPLMIARLLTSGTPVLVPEMFGLSAAQVAHTMIIGINKGLELASQPDRPKGGYIAYLGIPVPEDTHGADDSAETADKDGGGNDFASEAEAAEAIFQARIPTAAEALLN